MKREVKKEPEVPRINESARQLLTGLCFRRDDPIQKVDLIFVFAAFKELEVLVKVVKTLLSLNIAQEIFLTGGPVEGKDATESEMLYKELATKNYNDIKFWIEKKSSNTLENVTEALKVRDLSSYGKILFVFKRHAAGRGYLTLKKFLPNSEILQKSWSPLAYDKSSIEITRENWHKHEFARKRVWGEFLRICKYGERGDIAFDDNTADVVRKIQEEVKIST